MFSFKSTKLLFIFFTLFGGALISARVALADTNKPTSSNAIYLPLVVQNQGSTGNPQPSATPLSTSQPTATPRATTTPVAQPTPTPTTAAAEGAVWLPYRRSDDKVLPTYGASVSVDPQGGIHAAYTLLSAYDQAEDGYTVYAYCAANCTDKANWGFLHLSDASEVRLQLDAQGHPRLLLMTRGATENLNQHLIFQYAACTSNCINGANWSFTPLVDTLDCISCAGGRENVNNRYFALDPVGHPAFIYPAADPNNEYHSLLYYASCMSDVATCAQAANWTSGLVADGNFPMEPSLTFAGSGKPRLAFIENNSAQSTLYYMQCDQTCDDTNQWSWTKVTPTSPRESFRFSLAVDPNGRPRIALYSSYYNNNASSPFADATLYYGWCDANCVAEQTSGWNWAPIGLPALAGSDVDLALDKQGRPRMAYMDHNQGLGYSWCNQNCEGTTAPWQHGVAETNSSLSTDYDVLPIRKCTVSTWFTGVRPTLTLDAQGNPRIVYDAQHYWYGTETDGTGTHSCDFKDINVTRLAIFNQP